jgi:hypothetical protein
VSLDRAQGASPAVLRVEGKPPQSLPGLRNAHIDLVWSGAKSDFVVLHGAADTCPQSIWLATINDGNVAVHPLGLCHDKLALTEDGDRLLIRRTPPRGAATTIVYRDGDPVAYAVGRDTPLPRHGVAARHAEPVQDRRPAGDADTAASPVEPVPPAVPTVSAPVGEDVVPAPVGAGPLPAGAGRPIPPFAAAPPVQ